MKRCFSPVLVLITVSALLAAPAVAGGPAAVPPGLAALLTGRSYNAWGDAYLQWMCAIPDPANPYGSGNGNSALVRQGMSGPVFFLTGAEPFVYGVPGPSGAVEVERSLTMPARAYLFVPVTWVANIWIPACQSLDDYLSCFALVCTAATDAATGLHASLDGVDLGIPYRDHTDTADGWFSMWVPQKTFWDKEYPIGPGPVDYCYQEGYSLLLYPLSEGTHTLNYGSSLAGPGGALLTWNFTYHITVVAGNAS